MTKSLLRRMTGWRANPATFSLRVRSSLTLKRWRLELSQEYGDSSAPAVAWLRARGYTLQRDPDLALAQSGDNFLAIP
jgi:hypothetical protein